MLLKQNWEGAGSVNWKLNCDDESGQKMRKIRRRSNGVTCSLFKMTRLMTVLFLGQLWTTSGVSASYNFFMDRHEAQKLLGLSSDIFYVREGVVNEYALSFIVNVLPAVETLVFSWQATTKRPVHYDMALEFTDFFALLSPSSNISQTGRVPQKLENFRSWRAKRKIQTNKLYGLISLPCSGRIDAEVAVNIRFTFHLKQFKGGPMTNSSSASSKSNSTTINLKRNKICHLKEFIPSVDEPLAAIGTKPPTQPPQPPQILDKSEDTGKLGSNGNGGSSKGHSSSTGGGGGSSVSGPAVVSNSTLLLFQDPTPSLLLAGLLGGCVVTASIVFLIFFICLRRKLVPSSPLSSAYSSGGGIINSDPNSSNNSSPACLLRQSTMGGMGLGGGGDSKWTKDESCCDSSSEFKDKYLNPNSTMASRNSYVTIASFWNDIFGTHGHSQSTTGSGQHQQHQPQRVSSACHSHGHNGSSRFHGGSSHSQSHVGSHRPAPPPYPQILQHTNYHLNSTFNSPGSQINSTNNSSAMGGGGFKGSDVSPYAYAHIVPKIAPPPPPLIEWYSESTACNNGGHIFANNLFTFQSTSNPQRQQQHSPAHLSSNSQPQQSLMSSSNSVSQQPPPIPKSQNPGHSPPENNLTDGNASSTTRSAGSGSLIQIDGFQCRKNFVKDGNIVERFL